MSGHHMRKGMKILIWDEQPEAHPVAGADPSGDAADRFRVSVFTYSGPGIKDISCEFQPPARLRETQPKR